MSITKKQDQKRRIIIEKALDCLIENGIENTTISMIAQRADVPERSVYRYFKSKENIVFFADKLFWDYIYIGIDLSISRIRPEERTGIRLVTETLEQYTIMFRLNPEIFILLQEMDIYLHNNGIDKTEDNTLWQVDGSEEPLLSAFKIGAADGTIRSDIDLNVACNMIHDAFFGLMKTLAVNSAQEKKQEESSLVEPQLHMFFEMIISFLKR